MSWNSQSTYRSSTSAERPPSYHRSNSNSRNYSSYRDRDNYRRRPFNRDYHRSRDRRSPDRSSPDRDRIPDRVPRNTNYQPNNRRYDQPSSSNQSFSNRYDNNRPSHPYQRQQQQPRQPVERVARNPPPRPIPQSQYQSEPPQYHPESQYHPNSEFQYHPESQFPPLPPPGPHNFHHNVNTNVNPNYPGPPLPVSHVPPQPQPPPPPLPPGKFLYYNAKLLDEEAAAKASKKSNQEIVAQMKGVPSASSSKQPGENEETVIANIMDEIKGRGIFDKFRKQCVESADSMPAYNNLSKRVLGIVNEFLLTAHWREDRNRALRESLREKILFAPGFDSGIEQIIDQVINEEIMKTYVPMIQDVVYNYLGVPKPSEVEEKRDDLSDESKMKEGEKDEPVPMSSDTPPSEFNPPLPPDDKNDEPYSPCPPPPGESNSPPDDSQYDHSNSFTAKRKYEIGNLYYPSPENDSNEEELKDQTISNMKPSDLDKDSIANFLANQETLSEDDEGMEIDDDDEEESPAFEKFGETSPPRVNPEELRKQFDIPLDTLTPEKNSPEKVLPSKSKWKPVLSEPDETPPKVFPLSLDEKSELNKSNGNPTVGYFNCFSKSAMLLKEASLLVTGEEKRHDLNGNIKDKCKIETMSDQPIKSEHQKDPNQQSNSSSSKDSSQRHRHRHHHSSKKNKKDKKSDGHKSSRHHHRHKSSTDDKDSQSPKKSSKSHRRHHRSSSPNQSVVSLKDNDKMKSIKTENEIESSISATKPSRSSSKNSEIIKPEETNGIQDRTSIKHEKRVKRKRKKKSCHYLDPDPSLNQQLTFYQPYMNPLLMDDEVSTSSLDSVQYEDYDLNFSVGYGDIPPNILEWHCAPQGEPLSPEPEDEMDSYEDETTLSS